MQTLTRLVVGLGVVLALSIDGCAADTSVHTEPDAAVLDRQMWDCECWTSFRISTLANEHGPILLEPDSLPNGLRCSYDNPTGPMAEALCAEPGQRCDCSSCEPTGRLCGESRE